VLSGGLEVADDPFFSSKHGISAQSASAAPRRASSSSSLHRLLLLLLRRLLLLLLLLRRLLLRRVACLRRVASPRRLRLRWPFGQLKPTARWRRAVLVLLLARAGMLPERRGTSVRGDCRGFGSWGFYRGARAS
jgi:hypothetical protein